MLGKNLQVHMMKRAHDLVKICETTVVDKTSNAKKIYVY